ncbi:hypothetical protein Taro_030383 [Colocasia esculenta]|uniref:Uncharacterized protein n=1 Tax=Colocasia esculenta TaxID=4460 RepID=A0A843VP02_COLES|nr:hypothetical protein [Colocasia esculenta]
MAREEVRFVQTDYVTIRDFILPYLSHIPTKQNNGRWPKKVVADHLKENVRGLREKLEKKVDSEKNNAAMKMLCPACRYKIDLKVNTPRGDRQGKLGIVSKLSLNLALAMTGYLAMGKKKKLSPCAGGPGARDQTATLAQKNSEATRALALQEDILEKEIGEVQKVLLAMQSRVGWLGRPQPIPTPSRVRVGLSRAESG